MKLHANSPPTVVAISEMPPINRPHAATLLSVNDVCLALQCGRTFVYELLQKGELRPIKLGRLTRISRKELDAFLEGKAVDGLDGPGHRIDAAGSSRRESGSLVTHRQRTTAQRRGAAHSAGTAPAVEQPTLFGPAASAANRI
jgi:excisionase family DNA binding protein